MNNVISLREDKPWWSLCLKGKGGKLIPNHSNAMVALRHDGDLRDVFAYDQMLRAIVMTHEIAQLKSCDRWVTEKDVADLLQWMQRNGFPTMGLEIVRTAMNTIAHENSFHPVEEYSRLWCGMGCRGCGPGSRCIWGPSSRPTLRTSGACSWSAWWRASRSLVARSII